ncbi:DUF1338 domain-containing protein [Granulicella sp. WH15]|uniref:DUF1338 domain-containing protein n=1 Tax=Granulicella sp. WH15 TaxID=2602070 RepID=UPI001366A04B|nr:DUF1338 domain-containing protein [Granulicella sp. WH15]QHN02989.1 DUF1338 domain-containing protein [Granulicella sp. WH15]
MPSSEPIVLEQILTPVIGPERTGRLLRILTLDPALLAPGNRVSRAVLAQALNVLLFEDLIARVPAAALYVERCLEHGGTILHDHGAVRTVDLAGMGALPGGQEAIMRILRPLGYQLRGTYPLERLRMTGRSYAQAEHPETIAQFFISELHVDRFPAEFGEAVTRVTSSSKDPLAPEAVALLTKLEVEGSLSIADAVALLPALVLCFDRQHDVPTLADYEALLPHSAEMAWISTEGNAFNHATDRVQDVEKLTIEQKALGQPMKDKVEVSGSGRVRQTAFHAARVMRSFRDASGSLVEREVPGSFLEFIARDFIPGEATQTAPILDLSFDPSNAQAIFKMTATS